MLKRRLVPTLFGLAIVLALVLLRAADPYPIQAVREIAFDFYQRLQPRPAADLPVRVVDIDEQSLTELGQWPWPRNLIATMVDRLTELGAAAIAIDVLLPEPDRLSPTEIAKAMPEFSATTTLPDNDALLAQSIARAPVVLGFSDAPSAPHMPEKPKSGFAVSGTNPKPALPLLTGAVLPLPQLLAAAPGLGSLSLNTLDSAEVVRRVPLIWTDGKQFYPALSIEALRVATGVQTLVVLGETQDAFMEALKVGPFTVPTMPGGELWVYYRPPDPNLFISARDLLADDYQQLGDRLAGHIVFVGTSASGLFDIRGTTLGDNVPGVAVHAQAVEQILSGTYLTRTDWVGGLEIVGFLLLGTMLVVVVLRLGPISGLALGLAALGLGVAVSWWVFATYGVMIDPSFPLIGLSLVFTSLLFFQFVITTADKQQIRRAFGYYVAPELLSEIEKNGDRLKLGGELRDITVMFSDMRNFTAFSERHQPQTILSVLNTMFGALGANIVREKGTIDKFVGDAIMAFWNAPVDVPQHAMHACLAALGMRTTLRKLNEDGAFKQMGVTDPIVIGVGLASGEALVGNMGLETRFDYSCIGDTVNVASRVEGACKHVAYDIVVTDETRMAAGMLAFVEAGAISLKGKSGREPIFILVGDAALKESDTFRSFEEAYKSFCHALSDGAAFGEVYQRCRDLAAAVEPGLLNFLERMAERREDYCSVTTTAAKAAE
jgi:adenylate cyclase